MFYPMEKVASDSPRYLLPEQLMKQNDLILKADSYTTIYNIDLTSKPKNKKAEKDAKKTEKEKAKKIEKIEKDLEEAERNKRDEVRKEEIIEDIVDLLEKTMNPKRLLLAVFEALLATYSFISGIVFLQSVQPHQNEIYQLFIVLIVFGICDFLAFLTFILSLCQTQMALKGLRRGFQIICGLCTLFFFIMVVLVAFIVGLIGFYKSVYLYSRIKYFDTQDPYHIPPFAYRSCIFVFTLHLVITVSKYCCCR